MIQVTRSIVIGRWFDRARQPCADPPGSARWRQALPIAVAFLALMSLPPGYDPGRTYSLVLFFHMADVDEQFFVGSKVLKELDDMIVRGEFPPAIVACPDGTYRGWNPSHA